MPRPQARTDAFPFRGAFSLLLAAHALCSCSGGKECPVATGIPAYSDCDGGKLDPDTGLCWQDPVSDAKVSAEDAESLCRRLDAGGHDDWRLPDIDELRNLVKGCPATGAGGDCPVTDGSPSTDCTSDCDGCASSSGPGACGYFWDASLSVTDADFFWSSSGSASDDRYSWAVNFKTGSVSSSREDLEHGVRCVRTAEQVQYCEQVGSTLRLEGPILSGRVGSIAWSGSSFGAAWDGERQVFAAISEAGDLLAGPVPLVGLNSLFWMDGSFAALHVSLGNLEASCVSPVGDVEVEGIHISSASGPFSAAWTGSELGVVYVDARDLDDFTFFRRVLPDSTVVGEEVNVGGPFDDDTVEISLAWAGDGYGLSWNQDRTMAGLYNLYFGRLGLDGTPAGVANMLTDMIAEISSTVWTGSEFGVAWYNEWSSSTGDRLFLTMVDASGSSTDVSRLVAEGWVGPPSLLWTGSRFAVAWQEEGSIYLAHYSASGLPLGGAVELFASNKSFSFVWTGSEYGFLWIGEEGEDDVVLMSRVSCR